jgi:ligand-binding sensor domain-containing protein
MNLSMLYSKRNKLIIVFYFFLFSTVAQTLPCKNITINDGLPSNGIKCFFKDSRGLLWIGTDGGLCCYDGTIYKVFNETNGLKHDKVWSIVEDENNNLWISLYRKGLAKYDGKKFTYYDEKDGLVNNSIRSMHYSKKYKCLILATENGLGIFDGKRFKSFLKKKNERFQIVGIDETKDKILITSSYFGVYKLSINSNIQKSTLESAFSTKVSYSSYITNNTYYTGDAENKLVMKDLASNKIKQIPCPIIWDYAKDLQNNLYFTTWSVINPKGGLFKYSNNILTDITQQAQITSTALWCLFFDKETQQLWVGSNDKGIFCVDLSNRIRFFEPSFFGLKELQIQELYNDSNNNIWIGAKDNIIIIDKDLRYKIFDIPTIWKKLSLYFKQKGISKIEEDSFHNYKARGGFTSFNIVPDKAGNIWVNTTIGVICFDKNYEILFFRLFDGGHLIFDEYDQAYYGIMYSDVLCMYNKFDWTHFIVFSIKNSSVPSDITKIVKDGKKIWFTSSSKGLFILQNGIFYSLKSKGMFNEYNITDLIINDKGELVIGTNSGRVYITKWNGKILDVLHIYEPNKEIYGTSISFVEQSKDVYFIGSNKGINILKKNKFIKIINKFEGLDDIHFNDCIKDKNSNLWIATNSGLIQLNVDVLSKSVEASNTKIRITSIKVNGKFNPITDSLMRWGSYEKNKINLDYNQNDVEITFASNNTINADKNLFRYKIIGLSDTWSDFDSNGKIQLLGIPNGKYKLILEGKNIGTGEIFQSESINLVITPPFWKTWWFVLGSIVSLSIIGFILYKRRIHSIKTQERAKAEVQKRLAETKMEALQSQMNPHFIFNAMNSIQNYIIDNNTDDALMYMGEFSKLIRQTLNNSSQQRITLTDEINYIQSYIKLENMRFKNKIKFELVLEDDLDLFETEIPPMLLQPFIENVFVHAFDSNSKDPTLTLSLKQTGNYLYCKIKDNGKGMLTENLNKLNTSKGIKLAKERIILFQQDANNAVNIFSSPTGTSVILRLDV